MDYNTTLSELAMPEYGRNIQRLVEHAKTIENEEERQAFTEKIVDLIEQMNPQARNVDDPKKKIWGHVLRISNYELKVNVPDNVPKSKEEVEKRPAKVPYPKIKNKFRHYGKNVHNMIKKAIAMEDEEKKSGFSEVIGSYMKMAFKTWNRESVSDDQIKSDLENLSKGELTLPANANLDTLIAPNKKRGKSNYQKSNNKSNGYKKNNKGSYKRRKN